VIYARDELTAWLVALVGKKVVYEAHNFSSRRRWIYNKLRKSGVRLIVITKTLKEEFINSGWMEERVLVAADGVDIDKFNLSITQEQAREKLGIPLNKKIILYSGHLFGWKGVDIMAKAASGFPNACFIFVGGSGKEVDGFRNKYSNTDNIKIINQQPHQSIPYFLKAADVLVLPNSKQQSISRLYTSPLKMFEYMSSKRPIVASNLPSLREILNEGNSILVESDNSEALKVGIERLLSDKQLADRLSSQAFEDVQEFTWQKRAKKILEFI
jgi:glycosyltransferase involved in cell wall biosynthesis